MLQHLPEATTVLAHNVFSILRLSWTAGSLSSCEKKEELVDQHYTLSYLRTMQNHLKKIVCTGCLNPRIKSLCNSIHCKYIIQILTKKFTWFKAVLFKPTYVQRKKSTQYCFLKEHALSSASWNWEAICLIYKWVKNAKH